LSSGVRFMTIVRRDGSLLGLFGSLGCIENLIPYDCLLVESTCLVENLSMIIRMILFAVVSMSVIPELFTPCYLLLVT